MTICQGSSFSQQCPLYRPLQLLYSGLMISIRRHHKANTRHISSIREWTSTAIIGTLATPPSHTLLSHSRNPGLLGKTRWILSPNSQTYSLPSPERKQAEIRRGSWKRGGRKKSQLVRLKKRWAAALAKVVTYWSRGWYRVVYYAQKPPLSSCARPIERWDVTIVTVGTNWGEPWNKKSYDP